MAADSSSAPKDLRPLTLIRPSVPPSSSSEPFLLHPLPQASSSAPRTCPAHAAPNGYADPALAAAEDACPEDHHSTTTSRKVKFLCSFGGKILPRPSDGALRYVGGHTRIIAVRKDVAFSELMQKMVEVHGGPTVLKYQLPDEDLDALVTVSCTEDLENMMEEYDKLAAALPDGAAKMRVFLFSPAELESPVGFERGCGDFGQEAGQRYVEAVNGLVGESGALKRKDSLASASSTQNSDVDFSIEPCLSEGTSPSHYQATTTSVLPDPTKLAYANGLQNQSMMPVVGNAGGIQALPPQAMAPPVLPEQPSPMPSMASYVPQPEAINYVKYPPNSGHHIQYRPQNLGVGPSGQVGYVAVPSNSFAPGMHLTAPPTSPLLQNNNQKPVQARQESYLDENLYGGRIVPQKNDANSKPSYQPLSQIPPLTPSALQAPNVDGYPGTYVWPTGVQSPYAPHGHAVRLDDCFMCQKALPHVHSDTSVLDHRTSNASAAIEANPLYHSLQPGDAFSYTAHSVIPTNDAKDQSVGVGGTAAAPQSVSNVSKIQNESDRAAQPLVEFSEPHKHILPPPPAYYGDLLSLYAMPPGQLPQPVPVASFQNQLPSSGSPVYYSPGQQDLIINKAVVDASRHQPPPNLVPGQLPGNQGVSPNQVNFVDTASPRYQISHNADTPFLEVGNQLSDVPAGPMGGAVESLRASPETAGVYEQQKIAGKPDGGSRMKGMKPESPPKIPKNNDTRKPQIIGNDSALGKDVVNPGLLPEGRHSPSVPVDQLLPSTSVATSRTGMPSSSQLPPFLGDPVLPDFHNLGAASNPPLPQKLLLPVSTAANKSPTGVWREQDSNFPSRSLIDGVTTVQSANIVGPLPSSAMPSSKAVETHVPAPVDSFFDNTNLRGVQGLSVSPRKETTGETSEMTDLATEGYLKNNGVTGGQTPMEKGNYQARPEAVNKDPFPERVPSNKDGKIQQEMQALSEAVAESVLQSSVPHTADSTVIDKFAPDQSDTPMRSDNNLDLPNKDTKTALLDKLNLGFQITEDLERLQVIKNSDLEELRELGSGTFGTVYHGKWRGTDVAIKRINDRCFAGKASDQERLRADFWNEASNLAGLHHPNVVAFYGVVLDGPGGSVATVTEYMVNGSLRNALQRNDKILDWRKRLLIAMDAAFGMEYLHGKKIVHFDLKSDNLLVNLRDPHRPICKVGDLGLSKVKCQTLISGGVRGTLPWMAPELLNGCSSRVSEKVDVFSFGIVMWEILTGEEPYTELHYGAIIGGIVNNTLRPPVPESCEPEWRSLMERCWSAEPNERPTFTEVAGKLRAMSASLPPKGPSQTNHTPASSQAQR